MVEQTESLAAIRRRLLAGSPKTQERRASRKPTKPTSRELWKRTWAKINAEKATAETSAPNGDIATASTAAAPKPSADRLRAARKRGIRQGIE